jgi:hypothetical protein
MQRVIGIKRILSLIKLYSTVVFTASIPVLREVRKDLELSVRKV